MEDDTAVALSTTGAICVASWVSRYTSIVNYLPGSTGEIAAASLGIAAVVAAVLLEWRAVTIFIFFGLVIYFFHESLERFLPTPSGTKLF